VNKFQKSEEGSNGSRKRKRKQEERL